jgi:conjugal transfer/entry exclusion protein
MASNWYTRISTDLSQIPDFISYYQAELASAKSDVKIYGNVEKNIAALPGVTEHRFNQLQEIEAVLQHLNIQLRKIRRKWFQKYLEAYNRALTSRDAEKYVDGEQEVIDFETIINEVALLRNQWLGTMKGLDSKNFMLGHIVRLRAAGMEDITVS